jgi:sentrin-specific protease 1
MDNAGGHGTKDCISDYVQMMRCKYNIIILFQVPNSPETNLLDLGVWRALQSLVEILSFRERHDPEVLASTVYKAWNDFRSEAINKVYKRWELVLDLILLDNGGNRFVESFRGKLTNDPTSVASSTESDNLTSVLASAKKSCDDTKKKVVKEENTSLAYLQSSDMDLLSTSPFLECALDAAESIKDGSFKPDTAQQIKDRSHELRRTPAPALTQIELALVHLQLYGSGEEHEELVRSGNEFINRKSFRTLRPGKWIDDRVIDYFFKLLALRDMELAIGNARKKRCHFFSCYFMTKLLESGHYSFNNVCRWSNNVLGEDIFALGKIFIPINVNRSHWTCAVIFVEEKRIQYYDSMGGNGGFYTKALLQYLKDEWAAQKGGGLPDADKWRTTGAVRGVPRQQNGYDCGIFTCMFANLLSVDRPLSFDQFVIDGTRQKLVLTFMDLWRIDGQGNMIRKDEAGEARNRNVTLVAV